MLESKNQPMHEVSLIAGSLCCLPADDIYLSLLQQIGRAQPIPAQWPRRISGALKPWKTFLGEQIYDGYF